ncbi:hypothetical protein AX16_005890 [Volvariella volvacea WC 439]|nr:hypothetical protein AX16_005890 [Volvariella volvacea WC 439]
MFPDANGVVISGAQYNVVGDFTSNINNIAYRDVHIHISTPLPDTNQQRSMASVSTPPSPTPIAPVVPIQFLRAYSPQGRNHFYTTDTAEWENAHRRLGFIPEGVACHILAFPHPLAVPLFRLYHSGASDHFYTTSEAEKGSAQKLGYIYEGTAGFIYPIQVEGSKPLYRLYNSHARDHFYTISATEKDNAIARFRYTYEGITGWVLE